LAEGVPYRDLGVCHAEVHAIGRPVSGVVGTPGGLSGVG